MRSKAALVVLLSAAASPLAAQDPISAIDWLNGGGETNAPAVLQPLPRPGGGALPVLPRPLDEPPVASSGTSPEVEIQPLGAPSPEAVGLLPMSATGLPRSLWQASEAQVLVPLIRAVDPAVPALSALLFTLLLAEADAPRGSGSGAPLLLARLDRLLAEGAVDPGLALVDRAGGTASPALFTRWFDLALLSGAEEPPCRALQRQPALSDDLATRIYCDARIGDWDHAATVLGTARALGQLGERDSELLTRFLDPGLADGAAPVPPPPRPTPLQFRLFEAMGEALPTPPLPRAFAAADLSGTSGWRAQLLAAERLAQRGALSENRLLGLYSDRKPAASGGVWDRVAAIQSLEAALESGRADLAGPALLKAWPQMRSAGLLVPMARLFGARLAALPLEGRAGALAQRAALLSQEYETTARAMAPQRGLMATVAAVAQGRAPDPLPDAAQQAAIARAWAGATPPATLAEMLRQRRLGEVILRATALFTAGAEGNHGDLTDALVTLRAVGLEDTARRAAIQLMILGDEGALR
ncbi:hypothetical protein M4578_04835 [Salipiger sp. P9]|uniref:hypothetical protein n=1 Tax=Salipiger pentaromativorans TaxID=2943193 RepID=UPI0021585D14|nr:hypothetical protein [Salipiger pentaromativorans]MCR8547141.1 hypothetical protein [Salipiger pentaromativorans]